MLINSQIWYNKSGDEVAVTTTSPSQIIQNGALNRMTESILTRTCSTCKETKSFDSFHKNKKEVGGINYNCKVCANKARAEYRIANPDKVKAALAKWRSNPENRKRELETNKQWIRANKEKRAAHKRRARQKDPAKEDARIQRWRDANPERYRQTARNIVNRRTHNKRANGGTYSIKEWKELCDRFGNVCLDCGEKKKLTIDHVIPVTKGGTNFIDNLQPLCMTCNLKKGNRIVVDFRLKWKEV